MSYRGARWTAVAIAVFTLVAAFPSVLAASAVSPSAAPPNALTSSHAAVPSPSAERVVSAPPRFFGHVAPSALDQLHAAERPAITSIWGWYNVTSGLPAAQYWDGGYGNSSPPALDGVASATDPNGTWGALTVSFGGLNETYGTPTNQTWVYFGSPYYGPNFWQNVTNFSDAPPALAWASMDWDPNVGQFVLFGGENQTGIESDQTWLLNATTFVWTNDSYLSCFFYCPAPREAAAMAFSNTSDFNYTVLFGGCADFCSVGLNDTYILVPAFGTFLWDNITNYADAPSARLSPVFTTVVVPGYAQALSLYGGSAPFGEASPFNDTWIFYNGTWENLSGFGAIVGTPPPLVGAEGVYDWWLGATVVTGGLTDGDAASDQTWALVCSSSECEWFNLTAEVGGLPIVWGGIEGNTYYSEPVVFQGWNGDTDTNVNSTFVFQNITTVTPSISDLTPEENESVNFNVTVTGGSNDLDFGDFGFANWFAQQPGGPVQVVYDNTTVGFAVAGPVYVNVTALDYYDVATTASYLVEVGLPTIAARASVTATDVGVPVNFAGVLGGSFDPVNASYAWSFGDGATGTTENATHAYATPGTFEAEISVVDGLGNTARATVNVTVHARPTVTAPADATSVAVDASVDFTATVANGTAPFNYTWNFGDGSAPGYAQDPSHAYASAGSYSANVTVRDAAGVVVRSADLTITVAAGVAITASASANRTSAPTGGSIQFTVTASGGSGTLSYAWRFGDGNSATGATVDHAYSAAGQYTASVWVNDTSGDSARRNVSVTITTAGGGSSTTSSIASLPAWVWAVIVVIVLAAIVGVLLMVRGRRPRSPTPVPPPAPSPWSEGGPAAGSPPPGASGGAPPSPPPA